MAISDVGSAEEILAVTPSNSTLINCRAIYVGGTGNVAVHAVGDAVPVTFMAVPAGTILPVAAKYIMATGTTATNLVALL